MDGLPNRREEEWEVPKPQIHHPNPHYPLTHCQLETATRFTLEGKRKDGRQRGLAALVSVIPGTSLVNVFEGGQLALFWGGEGGEGEKRILPPARYVIIL